jgi:hypothetical protein
MKKALIAAVVMLLVAGGAFAGTAQHNVGCGIGTSLFKNSADDSTLLQVIQGVLNYFPPLSIVPTIGITAGTAECQQPKKFASNEKVREFTLVNMDNLARDIAQGRGETLDAFAEIVGVPSGDRPAFYGKLQAGFADIYTSPEVQMASVLDNIAIVSKSGN